MENSKIRINSFLIEILEERQGLFVKFEFFLK